MTTPMFASIRKYSGAPLYLRMLANMGFVI